LMEAHPWAWAFFIPFIVLATFTILNLFIGIIVSTMQELAQLPDPGQHHEDVLVILKKLDDNLRALRAQVVQPSDAGKRPES
jgi:voltage-gated sodium channel